MYNCRSIYNMLQRFRLSLCYLSQTPHMYSLLRLKCNFHFCDIEKILFNSNNESLNYSDYNSVAFFTIISEVTVYEK